MGTWLKLLSLPCLKGSLPASFLAQRQSESFPATIGIAPDLKEKGSLSEIPPPKHFALEEQTSQLLTQVPPSPQLCHEIAQLRAEVHALQFLVHQLVTKDVAEERSFKEELGAEGAYNTNQTTTTTTTTTTKPTTKTTAPTQLVRSLALAA